ncbi:MAG: GAF domain-containing SpoIIE family protein phosphatase [Bacteroidota bacterium]
MRLRRIIYLGGAFFLVLVKFTMDVIGKNVELDIGGLSLVRELTVIAAFGLLYMLVDAAASRRETTPVRRLGFILIIMGAAIVAGAALSAFGVAGFDMKNLMLVPLDYPTVFLGSLIALAFGLFSVFVFRILRDLILTQRRPAGRRNYLIFAVLLLAASVSTIMLRPLDSAVVPGILFGFAIAFAVVNSFRLPWIISLTKREKVFVLVCAFFLFVGFAIIDVMLAGNSFVNRALLYYSHPLREFVMIVAIFATLYAGTAFITTLFHLPTAEAFDRKRSEVSSLHTLSKLVTQVFDFNELVDTVTSMTLQVVEASRCWLEIIHLPGEGTPGGWTAYRVQVAGMKNITQEEIDMLVSPEGNSIRDAVIRERKPIVVDDLGRDSRFPDLKQHADLAGSLVVVPLVSHTGLGGILYAAKKDTYGFVKDDVDVISAFADQATVAIENSRLIRESIERERLFREMLVAQEMQKKLLPQFLPSVPSLEIDAVSTPAFEVGGDYYDFMDFGDGHLGVVVGDVSGKGVSAAFYMSEMKGIFQALGRMYASPKDFLARANEALAGSIDKHSFVSVLYAVIDVHSGILTVARAGHCPLLHISGDQAAYVRPNGLGMGLSRGAMFDGTIDEETIRLVPGDVCVLYTDGVTEARIGNEEFGYERLMTTVRSVRHNGATAIKDYILDTVGTFTEHRANDDDLTIVVMKWKGPPRRD